MPKLYARQVALTNVQGRIDYISNPKRQENMLAFYDGADATYWHQLARECTLASKYIDPKQNKKSVQGRELHLKLSNSLLQRLRPETIARIIAARFEEKYGRPCAVAVHFNKRKNNLHVHIVYSERELLQEPVSKTASRALFFDENGRRHYKKAVILDENGEVREGCKIVKKGEVYEHRFFGPVDPQFSYKGWLKRTKSEWLLPLLNGELHGDVLIREYDSSTGELPEQHIGSDIYKGAPEIAAKIEEYNKDVRDFNQRVRSGEIPLEEAKEVQEEMKDFRNRINGRLREWLDLWIERLSKVFKKPSFADLISSAERRQTEQLQQQNKRREDIER